MNVLSLKIAIKLLVLTAAAAVSILLAISVLSHHHTPSTASRIKLVTGENVWGGIMQQIGGDKVQVTSILNDPGADPHLYESNAHDALAVTQADIVVANGLGYDDFLDKLVATSSHKKHNVLRVSSVLDVTGKDPNPHLWYDIPRLPQVAQVFAQALAAQDPADAALFSTNEKAFDASLQPLLDKIAQVKAAFAGAPVAYTERVPGYLLDAMNLDVKTPAGFARSIEDGNDPSPADQNTMNNLIGSKQIKALLYNAQATSLLTERLRQTAEQHGIAVVAVTETIPAGQATYQSWQLNQLDALLTALQGARP